MGQRQTGGLLESTTVAFRMPMLSLLRKKGPGSGWLILGLRGLIKEDRYVSADHRSESLLESQGMHATKCSSRRWHGSIVIEDSKSGPAIRGIHGRVSILSKRSGRTLSVR